MKIWNLLIAKWLLCEKIEKTSLVIMNFESPAIRDCFHWLKVRLPAIPVGLLHVDWRLIFNSSTLYVILLISVGGEWKSEKTYCIVFVTPIEPTRLEVWKNKPVSLIVLDYSRWQVTWRQREMLFCWSVCV